MTTQPEVTPYGSARDVPSFKELEQQISGLKLFSFVLPKDKRKEIEDLKREHQHTIDTVDSFYKLLGERNWVFTGDLHMVDIQNVVTATDPATAEERLIDYYKAKNRINFYLLRLNRFQAMRLRIELLRKALDDYESGRYYSTVLVLLSVMDGFVNDFEPEARTGLHARSPEDMVVWDSVAGHHLGLGHAHRTFRKTIKKTQLAEATDLFRHGILHGMVVNFDNEVIATKAWNRLFAVADWADARKRRAQPVEPPPTLKEIWDDMRRIQNQKTRIEAWQPYEYVPGIANEDKSEVTDVCKGFLEKWQKQQWALVGKHFMKPKGTSPSVGDLAKEAKGLYLNFELSAWKLNRVRHVAASVAHADVELRVNGSTYQIELRWVRVDDVGEVAAEWEPGHWTLAPYGPPLFLRSDSIVPPDHSVRSFVPKIIHPEECSV